jgi:hypothetical protein
MKKKIIISLTELELRVLICSANELESWKAPKKRAFWRAMEKLTFAHKSAVGTLGF